MIRRLLVALGLAAALLIAIPTAPAHATGWSGQRCEANANKGWHLCAQVHTVPSGGGVRIDQTQLCLSLINGGTNTRKAFNNGVLFRGSAGQWLGGYALYDVGVQTCTYTNPPAGANTQMGNGACYIASGTIDYKSGFDDTWNVSGKVSGGAC
jgi:hypothetical protein